MANAQQVTGLGPSGEYVVIDAAPAGNYIFTTLIAGAPQYDGTIQPLLAAAGQGKNVFTNGTVLIDTNNDYKVVDASSATFSGNPAQGIPTAPALTISVLNTQMVRLIFKNPA